MAFGPDRYPADKLLMGTMTLDEAILWLRADPQSADVVTDSYLGRDVFASADRFLRSAEFIEVARFLGPTLHGAAVADIGAGVGIASYALLMSGAARVVAVEPDASDEVGRGAIERLRLATSAQIEIVDGWGEALPLADASLDVVYSRQVLHHATNLGRFMQEVERVLRPGGLYVACREHVVDNQRQRDAFLRSHPVHRLAGGENAYSLAEYLGAIQGSGLLLREVLGPWDSVINAYPAVRSVGELASYSALRLEARFGALGSFAARLPGARRLGWWRLRRPRPGRMYSFMCVKQAVASSVPAGQDGPVR